MNVTWWHEAIDQLGTIDASATLQMDLELILDDLEIDSNKPVGFRYLESTLRFFDPDYEASGINAIVYD